VIALALVAAAVARADTASVSLTPIGRLTFPERGFLVDFPHAVALRPGDVRVRENGTLIRDFTFVPISRSRQRVAAVLVVDASNSMRGRPLKAAFAATRTFVSRVAAVEPVGVVTFNATARMLVAPTSDIDSLSRALSRTPATAAGTRIYDAVAAALDTLRTAKVAGGSIVVLSDGADTGSSATATAVASRARAARVRIFTIGLHSTAFRPGPLRSLAAATGGSYSEASASGELAAIYRAIGAQLSTEYVLRYHSEADSGDDVQVLVQLRGYGSQVVSYTAPALHPAAPFRRTPLERFWAWHASFVVMGVLVALLVFGAVLAILRGPRSNLRARIADFVSVSAPKVEEGKRKQPLLSKAVFARTEQSLSRTRWWPRFKEELEIAQITIPPEQIVAGAVIGALLAGVILVQLSPVFVIFAFAVPLVIRGLCRRQLRKVRDRFAEQLPDNLQVLASALRAGHSFIGALAVVAADTEPPSRREFQRVVADEQLGVPVENSLREVARRMDSSEVEQVALVAELQRNAGGNMAEVLDRVVETIRSRFDVRRLVKTLTAQGRMARWIVSGLPVVLLGFISVIDPAYSKPLLVTTAGQVALAAATVMIIAGSLVIKKIINIKV
jgi:tight adherence protein B